MNIPELSLCFNPEQNSSFLADLLKSSTNPLLSKLQLTVRPLMWAGYKEELVKMALQNGGADMSQVGFPLTEDLISMNALLPISRQLIVKMGGQSAFHTTVWNIANRHQEGQLWSMPWLVDPRALFYWKDMLDKADLGPKAAFASVECMEDACQRMQARGIKYPWVLGMADKFVMIHAIASWVWGKGGDFILSKGNRAAFLEQAALQGMEAFFRLSQYMPAENPSFSASESHRFFVERKAAATIGDYGALGRFRAALPPEMRDLLGVALPPGPPLLAGSDLVIWRHTRKDEEVAHLFSILFGTEVQIKYSEYMGGLPVTVDALENLAESRDANIDTFIETLEAGRLFTTAKFGGMLELQLAAGLKDVWANLSQNPSGDVKGTIRTSLEPIRRRFDMMNEKQ
ncbi:MAG: extracellular solute-binding protein [Anaerolineales bacterium]